MVNPSMRFLFCLVLLALGSACMPGWPADCSTTLPDGGDGGVWSSGMSGRCNNTSEVATRGIACTGAARSTDAGLLRCSGQPTTAFSQQRQVGFRDPVSACFVFTALYISDSDSEALSCGQLEAQGCNLTPFIGPLTTFNCSLNAGGSDTTDSINRSEAEACMKHKHPSDAVSCSQL